ncbi:metal ion ABC transporter, permease protein [Mycoplasma haemofelis str. Langford 1]|uniref:Metal ion ABC transporter, permease protein n=1 Tax=Mycoplasma haemofelis (strain Langford 1) TaxID=941640 RepID=E8ZKE8_MYCHL|nr:energy-coupling factor transporter transmembrane component T [Mycoplasma haemofelis]CBY92114.1 metal ion ABC transporter, permease protein [Mycoplasma haemofelis str. Langford 1]
MYLENSYEPKDTPIHNLNPLVKFLIFLLIIFLLFLKITFLAQGVIFLILLLVIKYSDSQEWIMKHGVPSYLFLLGFLFMVNFVFMKSPGFWTENALHGYKDIFGRIGAHHTTGEDKVKHGWFFGGHLLKTNSSSHIALKSSAKCIERIIGWTSSCCSTCATDNYTLPSTGKWRIVPINVNGDVKYTAFMPAWYTISSFQIVNTFSLANKIIIVIILSSIFTTTSPMTSFTYCLEDIFRPLSAIKLPAKLMALTVAISLRFVPSLITESFRIIRAQASRGIDYKNGKFVDKVNALRSLFIPVFVISFLKSDELAAAMTARGYRPQENRTSFRIYGVKGWELLVMFCCTLVISCLYYLHFNHYYLSSFGNAELLISIAS